MVSDNDNGDNSSALTQAPGYTFYGQLLSLFIIIIGFYQYHNHKVHLKHSK